MHILVCCVNFSPLSEICSQIQLHLISPSFPDLMFPASRSRFEAYIHENVFRMAILTAASRDSYASQHPRSELWPPLAILALDLVLRVVRRNCER